MALSLHSWHSVRLMAHGQWGPARPRCPGAAVGPDMDLGALESWSLEMVPWSLGAWSRGAWRWCQMVPAGNTDANTNAKFNYNTNTDTRYPHPTRQSPKQQEARWEMPWP